MLDAATGREIWRVPRTERYNWAAPFVATHAGRRQIVLNGEITRGYDYDTGAVIWEAAGLGENSVPQMVQHGDLVFAMSGHTIKMLMAIRLGRRGTLTGTDGVAWSTARGVSYTPSPLLHDGKLYVVSDAGLVSCLDAATGRPFWGPERLPKPYNFKASPVGANGKLYLATEEGDVRRRSARRAVRGPRDEHAGGSVVHRVAGRRRRIDLSAQPHPSVSHRQLVEATARREAAYGGQRSARPVGEVRAYV